MRPHAPAGKRRRVRDLMPEIFAPAGRSSSGNLVSILPKSSKTKTSLSKMDHVFMIILLLNLGPDFENIRE